MEEEKELILGSDDGYDLVDPYIKDPWLNLANAIVISAARDYRKSIKDLKVRSWRELEKFFNSEWYQKLSRGYGNEILERLRAEQRENYELLTSI